jgi:hypothetical protein
MIQDIGAGLGNSELDVGYASVGHAQLQKSVPAKVPGYGNAGPITR